MASSYDTVLQAFQIQADPQSTTQQIKEVMGWLEKFQGTTEAWQVADQLLAAPKEEVGVGAHTFAAQTMRSKIQYDWAELPVTAHESLRSSLLNHVLRFGQGPVLTQLCLAVGVLVLHMQSWNTAVSDLITSLTQPAEQATAKLPCLLEMLTVLPEEAENYKVGVLPAQREAYRQVLRSAGPQVLTLLSHVCQQCRANEALMQAMLRCTCSWVRLSYLPSDDFAASPMLEFAFHALGLEDPELFDEAADLVVEAITFSQDHARHQALISNIVTRVLQLQPQYDKALADDDEEKARALCRIFAEMGENYLQLILQHAEQWALPVASAVLRGAAHPEPEVAEITFNFWYVLSNELGASGRSLNDAQKEGCRRLFAPIFLQLIDALRRLAEFPPDSDSWSADRSDDFKSFRSAPHQP